MYKFDTKWGRLALVAILLSSTAGLEACGTTATSRIQENAVAKNTANPGSVFSSTVAVIRRAGDIPGVPESNGRRAPWTNLQIAQFLHLDAECQEDLILQLPKWARDILKEGGMSALLTAIGEGGFAAAFPGAPLVRYILGGAAIGGANGVNTGRYRHETSEQSAIGACLQEQIRMTRKKYGILDGIAAVTWYGNGDTTLLPPDNLTDVLPQGTAPQGLSNNEDEEEGSSSSPH